LPADTEYDPNFFGGIDELLPNDIPEVIDGVNCPDHGELWTLPLKWQAEDSKLMLEGILPRFGLRYERVMSLRDDDTILDLKYRVTNISNEPRHFLWKMHAALGIEPGDVLECPAVQAQVADPKWSRFTQTAPFAWPMLDGQDVSRIPAPENTMDFFYLFDLKTGTIAWRRPNERLKFLYQFDTSIFPFAWIFASYGGFLEHYTVILEPCTAMPISVNDAIPKNNCAFLAPGEEIETSVVIWAGREESSPAPR
jgi:hypothetical protein